MILQKDGNIAIITQEKASITELVRKLQIIYKRFDTDNIIINLTNLKSLSSEDLIEFLAMSNEHRDSKYSFVIVTNKIQIDDIPDELIVVPSLKEAYDIIEMEEIERDLDF